MALPYRPWTKRLILGVPLLLLFLAFVAYEYNATSTTQYCGTSCHIMKPFYESTLHNVHREPNNVHCKDCHLPQGNLPLAIVYKGYSGAKDIYKNTFDQPDVIHASPWSQQIIQKNCLRCHNTVVEQVKTDNGLRCFECHRGIPHDQRPQPFSNPSILATRILMTR